MAVLEAALDPALSPEQRVTTFDARFKHPESNVPTHRWPRDQRQSVVVVGGSDRVGCQRMRGYVFVLLCACTLVARGAAAEEKRSVAILVEGNDPNDQSRQELEQFFQKRFAVVSGAGFRQSYRDAGGDAIARLPTKAKDFEALRTAGQQAHVSAVIVALAVRTSRARQIWIEVIDPASPTRAPVKIARLAPLPAPADEQRIAAATGAVDALASASSSPAQAPEPETDSATSAAPDAAESPSTSPRSAADDPHPHPSTGPATAPAAEPPVRRTEKGAAAVATAHALPAGPGSTHAVLGVDIGFGSRSLDYRDGMTASLRPYESSAAPAIALGGEVYPAAQTRGFLSNLGALGEFQQVFLPNRRAAGGNALGTSWTRYDFGLRYRINWAPVHLGIGVGYGREAFALDPRATDLATANLHFMRLRIDGRFALGEHGIIAEAAYLAALGQDGLGDEFRSASVGGMEFGLGLALHLYGPWELVAKAVYTRYAHSFDPEPGDPFIASGALDEMVRGRVGGRLVFE